MDAKPRSLKDIFDAQCRYLVPLYQRPYVWRLSEQWEPLWEDVLALAERYVRQDVFRPHFMGAVVLDQLNTATGTLDVRQIIDGQQRLTTLQIIVEAACDVCETLGSVATEHARALRRLTRNDQRTGDPDETFKVWPTNVDRENFRRVMSAGSPSELHQLYDEESVEEASYAIADGYLFFYEKIREWLTTDNEELLKKKLDALQNALYRGIMVVVIDLDEKDDAQMIFETLNARGTPLLASDLVKNYLLHQADARGHNLDELYNQYWKFFDSNQFWRNFIRTGRFKRPHIEVFLQNYLALLTRDEVLVTNLFNTFRQNVKENPSKDPADYLADLHRYGQIYLKFYNFPSGTPEGQFFNRIEMLDTTTVFPLLLHVFDKLGKPEKNELRRSILTDIESFLVRRMVCELTTKNYNNLFQEVVKQIADAEPNEFGSIIRQYFLSQTSDIGRWPNDEEFQEAWRTLPAYKRLKPQMRLRLVLEALEFQKRGSNLTEETSLPNQKLSIEHIMPRGWVVNWPLQEDTLEARDAREALIHTLGNLTLVTGPLNSTLSNNPWTKKKKTLRSHSILLLNADLQEVDAWSDIAIKNRSAELFELAQIVWPVPKEIRKGLPNRTSEKISIGPNEQVEIIGAISKRDMKSYDVSAYGVTLTKQAKRKAIYFIVKTLCNKGVTPEQITTLIHWKTSTIFFELDKKLSSTEFKLAASKSKARAFDQGRWYCDEDEVIYANGKTYAFTKMWGNRTAEAIRILGREFPDAKIEFGVSQGQAMEDTIDGKAAVEMIRQKFETLAPNDGVQIPLQKNSLFIASLSVDGITVDNLGTQPLLPWGVFEETVNFLASQGGKAKRGDAMNSKLGDEGLSLESIEGHIAQVVYGKKIGESVFRRISPIAGILVWAEICESADGELVLL